MLGEGRDTVYGQIACDFRVARLSELCMTNAGIQTGPFGSQLHQEDYVTVGTPIITVEHLGENRVLHNDLPRVSDYDSKRLSKYSLRKGDIVFSRVGSVDRRALVQETEDGWLFSGRCLRVRPDPAHIDPAYLSYFFGLPSFKEHIRSIAVGATMPSLNTQILSDVVIYLPSLSEQRAIAHFLGTLDDKIELNRRMNETLEAMARSIFKSWFVDFDPVRAKAEGRNPGLPKEIADLFPDSFEDSVLGEIPKGWRVGRFSDVAEVVRDQDNPLESPYTVFSHYSIPAFDEGYMPKSEKGEKIKSLKFCVPAEVVLLSKLNPEIERVWLVDVRPDDRAICSTEFLVLRARSPFTKTYVYCLARSPLFRQQIEGLVTGTSKSHQRAQADSVLNLVVVIPPATVLEMFERFGAGLLTRTLGCRRESRTLAALRDTLLPKLISGELRVKDAERFVARGAYDQ